jgi:large subunit ribosomal protein L35Ae
MVKSQERVFSRAVFTGYRRGKTTQHEQQALLSIEGVKTKEAAEWYLGKRVAYVYTAKKSVQRKNKASKVRSLTGKIVNVHGSSGVVRAKFSRNLPSEAIGKQVRVFLYPHRPSVN